MTEQLESSGAVLEVHTLGASRGGVEVLRSLDLQVHHGEVVAVQGASGAGKSTLLQAACGLIADVTGTIRVAGVEFSSSTERHRSRIRLKSFGLVSQGDELLPELTIGENVSLPLRLVGEHKRTCPYRQRAAEELRRFDIESLIDRYPAEVSGGQLQRASIARALIHRPSIVLADEPTASLDTAAARDAMVELIDAARTRRTAIVIVTHDEKIAALCDRVEQLVDGRLLPSLGRPVA